MLPSVLVVAAALAAPAGPAADHEQSFFVGAAGEVVARVRAGCTPCDWGKKGREAAVLELRVDGRYAQHLFLSRGAEADYEVALGRLEAGEHRLRLAHDLHLSARHAGRPRILEVVIDALEPEAKAVLALAHAPILFARANTVGRFSDLP